MAASLNQNALTTLSKAKSSGYLDLSSSSSDDYIRDLINQASQFFEDLTHRLWYRVSDHKERVGHGGRDRKLLVEDHVPVEKIREIRWEPDSNTSETIDPSHYTLRDAKRGLIFKDQGLWEDTTETVQNIVENPVAGYLDESYVVKYDGGYLTPEQKRQGTSGTYELPDSIERAVLMYVQMKFYSDPAMAGVESWSIDDASVTYMDGVRVPTEFAEAVDTYKRAPWA